ncbi:MAG: hypothetical protein CMM49_03065 [Rhodospirillaceae bacterium]|nr:hypothetical protein [Rhodospirillaceae bacterium]
MIFFNDIFIQMISTLLFSFGWSILFISLAMFFPALISFSYNEISVAFSFIFSSSLGLFSGVALLLASRGSEYNFSTKVIIIFTIFVWPLLGLFSSLPFLFSDIFVHFTDAFFESMSGITSSGSSIIIDVSKSPKGILFWRSLLQWIGGFLTIILAISVLSLMRIGGMDLFHSSLQKSDRDTAVHRFIQASKSLWWIYLLLTVVCSFSLIIFGMSPFDSVVHALSTVSTGGFSSKTLGINEFSSLTIEFIICIFMLLGSLNFTLYWAVANGKWRELTNEGELKYLIGIIIIYFIVSIFVFLTYTNNQITESLRVSVFNIISSVTTTGYYLIPNENYIYNSIMYILFISLMLIGGASVSTSGGVKQLRLIVFFKLTFSELFKLTHPNGVYPINYMKKNIDENSLRRTWSFLMTFISIFVLISILFSLVGLGFVDSLSLSTLSLTNTGAGAQLLSLSIPYYEMDKIVKWIIIISQLLGRIEIMLLLIFISPNFWRN